MVLVLIVPATLALLVLAQPAVALIFQHGEFSAHDTFWTAWALRYYLLGLVFAAVDWPLNYAFYARQNTLTPALVGVLSVGVYLAVALRLIGSLGMLGLVLADSAKHFSHASTMFFLSRKTIGRATGVSDVGFSGLARTAGRSLLAGGVMAGVMALGSTGLARLFTLWHPGDLLEELIVVGSIGGLGLSIYIGLATVLHLDEVYLFRDLIRKRLTRSNLD
jgi:putative peptidoglycan lipid II flippase